MKRLFAILLCLSIFCSIGVVSAAAQTPVDTSASASDIGNIADTADPAAARSTLIIGYGLTPGTGGNTVHATATLSCSENNLSSTSVRVYIDEQLSGETTWTMVRTNNGYGGTTASAYVSYTKKSGASYRARAYFYAYGLDGSFESKSSTHYF